MIIYLDTSALIKLYVKEEYSSLVSSVVKKANHIASHTIAFVEIHAAFARLWREEILNDTQIITLKNEFTKDWRNYLKVEASDVILHRAAEFAEAFALRAYDSVHLAAADLLLKEINEPITFACFDRKLTQAAKVIGLNISLDI